VNQHLHWWYLHLLGKDLFELIISRGNVKFGLKDLDLVLGWDIYIYNIYMILRSNPKELEDF